MRVTRAVVAAFLLFSASAWSQKVKAKLLYDFSGGRQTVLPLTVELETSEAFEGRVVATMGGGHRQSVSQSIRVGQGKFRFEMPLIGSPTAFGNKLEVSIVTKSGKTVASQYVVCGGTTSTRCWTVGWIDAPNQFVMQRFTLSDGRIDDSGQNPLEGSSQDYGYDSIIQVRQVDHESLPKDWRMYRGLDVIVIGKGGANAMGAAQVDALEQWVVAGGTLVVGGNAVNGLKSPFLARFGTSPQSGDRAVERGLGYVVNTSTPFLFPDRQARRFCQKILQEQVLDKKLLAVNASSNNEDYHYYVEDWHRGLWQWLNLERLSKLVLIGFIVSFVVVVGIVDRVALKLLKRRHWTWYTVPILVVVFCIVAQKLATISRGYTPRMSGVYVHDYGMSGSGMHHSLFCFTKANSRRVEMPFAKGWAFRRMGFDLSQDSADVAAALELNDGVFDTSAPAWTPMFIEAATPHTEEEPFKVKFQWVDGELHCAEAVIPHEVGEPYVSFLRVGTDVYVGELKSGLGWSSVGVLDGNSVNVVWERLCNITSDRRVFDPLDRTDPYEDYRFYQPYAAIRQILQSMTLGHYGYQPFGSYVASALPTRRAVLIVICPKGREPALQDGGAIRSRGLHVYRQIVTLDPDDDEDEQ